jgi:hypothetical protein
MPFALRIIVMWVDSEDICLFPAVRTFSFVPIYVVYPVTQAPTRLRIYL